MPRSAAHKAYGQAFLSRLRAAMDGAGLNQADLARELGVGQSTVSEWFNRRALPKTLVLARLPGILKVNPTWLLTGEGAMTPSVETAEDVQRVFQAGGFRAIAELELLVQDLRRRWEAKASSHHAA